MINIGHSDSEIEEANRRFERLADELDADTARVESTEDLRAIAEAAEAGRVLDVRLREAVRTARAGGKSCGS